MPLWGTTCLRFAQLLTREAFRNPHSWLHRNCWERPGYVQSMKISKSHLEGHAESIQNIVLKFSKIHKVVFGHTSHIPLPWSNWNIHHRLVEWCNRMCGLREACSACHAAWRYRSVCKLTLTLIFAHPEWIGLCNFGHFMYKIDNLFQLQNSRWGNPNPRTGMVSALLLLLPLRQSSAWKSKLLIFQKIFQKHIFMCFIGNCAGGRQRRRAMRASRAPQQLPGRGRKRSPLRFSIWVLAWKIKQ